jgi:hypothetical protein
LIAAEQGTFGHSSQLIGIGGTQGHGDGDVVAVSQ